MRHMAFLDGRRVLAFFRSRFSPSFFRLAVTRVRNRGPCPLSRLRVAPIALRQWCGVLLGRSASMTVRAFGAVPKPTGRRMMPTLRHCRPPFSMMRRSFEGCLNKSRCTASVDFSGCRAQTHMPSERATIIADMIVVSQRRVSLSS